MTGKPTIRFCATLFALAAVASFSHAAEKKSSSAIKPVKGETYYTQFSLFHEDYEHRTTNYRIRTLVPINTPVKFISMQSMTTGHRGEVVPMTQPEIVVMLPEGKELHLKNVQKYSGEDLTGIFTRTLGKEKVSLDKFTTQEKDNILAGIVEKGMTKDAVIRAMGYPPKHRTPSLSGNSWTYWRNIVVNFEVRFRDDKVILVQ